MPIGKVAVDRTWITDIANSLKVSETITETCDWIVNLIGPTFLYTVPLLSQHVSSWADALITT